MGRAHCADGVYQGDKGLGEACQDADECQHGFCTNNVCCNTACDEACTSCDVTGSVGFCTPESDGTTCTDGTCSDGDCLNTSNDPENCGGYAIVCQALANAQPTCESGTCNFACEMGFRRCKDGCIVDDDATCCVAADFPEPDLCQAPATCVNSKCTFSVFSDGSECGDPEETRVCCDGVCCESGLICEGGACQTP